MSLLYPVSSIIMLKPKRFGFNELTASSNIFQQKLSLDYSKINLEFNQLVANIKSVGIDVLTLEDTEDPPKPDAVFLNNWISTHEDGSVFIYPMEAINRRIERRAELIEQIYNSFVFSSFNDLSSTEKEGKFLEGTGSLVIDHLNRTVYATISSRTNEDLVKNWATQMHYTSFCFHAFDQSGKAIYHTNVFMSIGEDYAIICLEAIPNPLEKARILSNLEKGGKRLINISYKQMNAFAGNCLQLRNKDGKKFIVISSTAYSSLSSEQISLLTSESDLIIGNIPTIEKIGGGSVRCMIAENFLEIR